MSRLGVYTLFLFFACGFCLQAQVSVDCINAVPICNNTPLNGGTVGFGIDDFNGSIESGCLRQTVSGVIETNAAWYRFRTGASGELGFNIAFDSSEDWDFALYKATDCTLLGEPVRCNFFDNSDAKSYMGVGVDPTGDAGTFLYEDWLQVEPGEDYYLLLNNFSNTNSGFSIQFSGSIFVSNPLDALDCSIINNLLGPPVSACDTDTVVLDATTLGALSYEWYLNIGTGFTRIPGESGPTLNVAVSALYRVVVVMPSNENIISETQVAYSPAPVTFPLSDEVVCSSANTFALANKDIEALAGQSPEDFRVSYHASQAEAISGDLAFSKSSNTLTGTSTIYVRITSVENSNCFDASQHFNVAVVESPSLDFSDTLFLCAKEASGTIGELVANPNYTYQWDTGENTSSITVTQAGIYTLTATHNQSGIQCSNTKTVRVVISELPAITDVEIEDLNTNNIVTVFINLDGEYTYQLNNGEIQSSNTFKNVPPGLHVISVIDLKGCGSVTEEIVVVGFSEFFTPNGDSINDFWHINGLQALENPQVYIYDRYGKLLQQLNANSKGWDGTFNGSPMPASDYWFKLRYQDKNGASKMAKYVNNHFSLKR